ncbi:MAG: YwiC-like family protein [Bryobacterales bacterium]|nr:YwiC-like family protein [Bryobacterales bacterium]
MSQGPSAASGVPIPREHGAWGLLLQPFLAASVLAGFWSWTLAPALLLVVLGFMVKEPLVVLARQRWVWRGANPQTPRAMRWLVIEFAGILACLGVLVRVVPATHLIALTSIAILLTMTAVWFTVTNRQRSVMLQLLSAAGLSTSALLVVLLSEQSLPVWSWQLWAVLSLHAAGSILVVHERLRRVASRKRSSAPSGISTIKPNRAAPVAQLVQVAAGALSSVVVAVPLWLPLFFSAIGNSMELHRLRKWENLDEPLKRVGFRTLGLSLAHMVVTIIALWTSPRS